MNREILFRGKRVDNGEWVTGNYMQVHYNNHTGNNGLVEHWIYPRLLDVKPYIVIPETVGEFTGLTDKNGTKIFEGDVLTWPNGETGFIAYEASGCQFRIQSEHTTLHIGLNIGDKGQAVVTGNIHDK